MDSTCTADCAQLNYYQLVFCRTQCCWSLPREPAVKVSQRVMHAVLADSGRWELMGQGVERVPCVLIANQPVAQALSVIDLAGSPW